MFYMATRNKKSIKRTIAGLKYYFAGSANHQVGNNKDGEHDTRNSIRCTKCEIHPAQIVRLNYQVLVDKHCCKDTSSDPEQVPGMTLNTCSDNQEKSNKVYQP